MTHPLESGRRNSVQAGLTAAWPICLGYFPIGLSLGVLAQKAGIAPWQMAAMSILVFAGGSQFIAVAMLAASVSPLTIVSTTFMINLRHLLMSSALSVYFPGVSRRFLALFAYMGRRLGRAEVRGGA
jgi:predicted branched-subunit amino acid permease